MRSIDRASTAARKWQRFEDFPNSRLRIRVSAPRLLRMPESMLPASAQERFEIIDRLGSRSFGVVYEAFDRYRNRNIALKILERASADSVARFKREFRTLAEVRHPNLASLYELLKIGDQW